MTQLPIPVHVGSETPDRWDETEALQREMGDEAGPYLRNQRRPSVADPDLDWAGLGFEPRRIGSDTADCAAALHPASFSGPGLDEFKRFRQGAASRGELALVISPVGQPDKESSGLPSIGDLLGLSASSVSVGPSLDFTRVHGRLLGKEAKVHAAGDLGDSDSHLARWFLSCNPAPRWRSLSLSGATLQSIYGAEHHPATGSLLSILETNLGEPVVAAWLSPDGSERHYIVPVETPWPPLLQWLRDQALPEFVPGALRRARRHLGTDVFLMTRAETAARTALTDLEADYTTRKKELERQLGDAEAAASTIREGLLYGTGKVLEHAVRMVLESAGITIVDLDDHLGGTKNGDLLCTYGDRTRLVEVKAASGNAPERAYQDLVRHLREWPTLPGSVEIEGGALVINHEHRKIPQDRSRRPFSRPEFLAAQAEPVIAAIDLFEAWRNEDADTIRHMLFGHTTVTDSRPAVTATVPPAEGADDPTDGRRRWFGRRPRHQRGRRSTQE